MLPAALLAQVKAAAKESPQVGGIPVVPGRTLIVDGDGAAYYHAGTDGTPLADVIYRLGNWLAAKRSQAGAEFVKIHLTAEGSTKGDRYIISTIKPYQGKRKSGRQPANWQGLRNYMTHHLAAKVWNDREADDAIAMHANALGPELSAILSDDKDLRMVPGHHVSWRTESMHYVDYSLFKVQHEYDEDKQFGTYWFWLQMLMGDTVDNIPGLERLVINGKATQCGQVRATAELSSATDDLSAYRIVRAVYQAYYHERWAERFAEQAALLWLRRGRMAHVTDYLNKMPACKELATAFADLDSRITAAYAAVQALPNNEVSS